MEMELQMVQQGYNKPAEERKHELGYDAEKSLHLPPHFLPNNSHQLSPFIEANTESVSLSHLRDENIIPVFTKDNEITISHQEFIHFSSAGLKKMFGEDSLTEPEIRVSHQIKGRTPDALHIPAKDLQEHQKTIYYERMAWIVRIPSITKVINGNTLSLVAGGVRSYSVENLYSTKRLEHFKFFIGFQNMVCCNLCVNTDGMKGDIKAASSLDLESKVVEVIENYNIQRHLEEMEFLLNYSLTEEQFAQIIGKCRLYNYLPKKEKSMLPEMLLNDSHLSTVAKDYYHDDRFCRAENGNLSMWQFYNLLTGSNKSSYVDTFLERGVNAFGFAQGVSKVLSGDSRYSWFLS